MPSRAGAGSMISHRDMCVLHNLAQGHVCAPQSRLREAREGGGNVRENIKPLFGGGNWGGR